MWVISEQFLCEESCISIPKCWKHAVIFSDIALVVHCYSIEPVEDLFRFVE